MRPVVICFLVIFVGAIFIKGLVNEEEFKHMTPNEHLEAAKNLCKQINTKAPPFFTCSDRNEALHHLNQIPQHGTMESDEAFADRILLATDESYDQEAAQKREQEEQEAQAKWEQEEQQTERLRATNDEEDKMYQQVWEQEYKACLAQSIPLYGEGAKQFCANFLSKAPLANASH